jgi:hypothetical protein
MIESNLEKDERRITPQTPAGPFGKVRSAHPEESNWISSRQLNNAKIGKLKQKFTGEEVDILLEYTCCVHEDCR